MTNVKIAWKIINGLLCGYHYHMYVRLSRNPRRNPGLTTLQIDMTIMWSTNVSPWRVNLDAGVRYERCGPLLVPGVGPIC